MKHFFLCFGIIFLFRADGSGATVRIPGEYATIQEGIDAVVDSDTVLVTPGTYTGYWNKNLDYRGKKITVLSEEGPEQTVIDCELEGRGVYFHSGEDSLSIFDGFTIKNGYVTGGWPEGWGGGIFCNRTGPSILNCILTENEGDGAAGIANPDRMTRIINCKVFRNRDEWVGGITGASLVLDCEIFENKGCGVFDVKTIQNCEIYDNYHPTYPGGGIFAATNVINCNIYRNTALDGGGISGSSYVQGCVIGLFADPGLPQCSIEEEL